jgi:hypothetical protein
VWVREEAEIMSESSWVVAIGHRSASKENKYASCTDGKQSVGSSEHGDLQGGSLSGPGSYSRHLTMTSTPY